MLHRWQPGLHAGDSGKLSAHIWQMFTTGCLPSSGMPGCAFVRCTEHWPLSSAMEVLAVCVCDGLEHEVAVREVVVVVDVVVLLVVEVVVWCSSL